MILGAPGKISIMVDGQVVGTTAKPIHIVTENYTKAEAIAEAADIKRPRNFQTLGAHRTSSSRGTYHATQWFGTLATCCVTC